MVLHYKHIGFDPFQWCLSHEHLHAPLNDKHIGSNGSKTDLDRVVSRVGYDIIQHEFVIRFSQINLAVD